MKKFPFILSIVLLASACHGTDPEVKLPSDVLLEPVITRATEVNFEVGDRIGLSITKEDGMVFAQNTLMTYDGKNFSGDQKWYSEGGVKCSLRAFYPYDAAGFPASFTVGADQTSGAGAFDLMLAVKNGVVPQDAPVAMVFQHQLSQIVMNVDNSAGIAIDSVIFKGLLPTEVFSFDAEGNIAAAPDETAAKIDIAAEAVTPNIRYRAIVVPQTMAFGVRLKTASGASAVESFTEVTMKPGYTYTINAKVTPEGAAFSLAGEIKAWENGGIIEPGSDDPVDPAAFEEHLDEGYFNYAGERYSVVKMKDGKYWMAENMRFVPSGITPSSDLNNVAAGVYYPLVMNAGCTGIEFSTDEAAIKSNGYLYQSETALGLSVGTLRKVEDAEKLEGAQGICPEGWHIPTADDILNLVGKAVSPLDLNTKAPYYDKDLGGSIALLNEDGFNASAWGAVSVIDLTRTSATMMGFTNGYDRINSGYICGSTYAGVTYNTKDDPSSGVKNLQFFGFMPMTKNGTFNGSKLSFMIAASVRCVRNSAD